MKKNVLLVFVLFVFCLHNNIVIGQTFGVSGAIGYDDDSITALNNATVLLLDETKTNLVSSVVTNVNGDFLFTDVPDGNYVLTAFSNSKWKGSNATDALRVIRHVAGFETLTGLKANSADVNNSGSITATDAFSISSRTAGVIDTFAVPDWLFEEKQITVSGGDVVQNLLGIAAGDVDASYFSQDRGIDSDMELALGYVSATPGNISVPLSVKNMNGVGAFSLSISYDNSVLTFIETLNFPSGCTVNHSGNTINIAWFDGSATGQDFGTGVLGSLSFQYAGGYSDIYFNENDCEIADNVGQKISVDYLNGGVDLLKDIANGSAMINNFDDPESTPDYWRVYGPDPVDTTVSYIHQFNETSDFVEGSGSMRIDYSIINNNPWGGFIAMEKYHDNLDSTFNFSTHDSISFYYNNIVPASQTGRVHLRFKFYEISDSPDWINTGDVETYYSFHYILDNNPGWHKITIPMMKNQSWNGNGFNLTGWSGIQGNTVLNLDKIKGFDFEFSVNGSGEGDIITGSILFDAFHLTGPSLPTQNVTCADIQTTPDFNEGPSPYEGRSVQVSGTINAIQTFGYNIQDGSGPWNGLWIYDIDPSHNKQIGDNVTLTGKVYEYYGQTELLDVVEYTVNSSGNQLPAPVDATCADLQGEAFESVYASLHGAVCTIVDIGNGRWEVEDGTSALVINNRFTSYVPTLYGVYDIQGLGGFWNDARSIDPLTNNDIVVNPQSNISINPASVMINDFDDSESDPNYWEFFGPENYDTTKSFVNLQNETVSYIEGNGSTKIDYSVENGNPWGGLIAMLRNNADTTQVFDFSTHDSISFCYNNIVPASEGGRIHLRLKLTDVSDSPDWVNTRDGEVYYSFHYILDDSPGWHKITIPLMKNQNWNGNGFNLTGWAGIQGNTVLNTDQIMAYDLEFSVNGSGEGDIITGSILIDALHLTGPSVPAQRVTCADIQKTPDLRTGPSPFEGRTVTVSGVINAVANYGYNIQDAPGPWNGLWVYDTDPSHVRQLGDSVLITGKIYEYYGQTEMLDVTDFNVIGQNNPLPNATVATCSDLQDEQYESVFALLYNAVCTNADLGNGRWEVNDGTGFVMVNSRFVVHQPVLNENYTIKGIGGFWNNVWAIDPISANDIIQGNAGSWQADILVYDAGGQRESNTVTFGQSPSATDGLDESLGELELPPLPPTGTFDARFIFPSPYSSIGSLADFRNSDSTEVTWKLSLVPSDAGYPITLMWDPNSLPEGRFTLDDGLGGTVVNVDMKAEDIYSLSVPLASLQITYKYELQSNINMHKGWNMVSVPLKQEDMSKGSLFPNLEAGAYEYNGSYNQVEILETGKGYWVKNSISEVVSNWGIPDKHNVPVASGWNMVGVYDNEVDLVNVITNPQGILVSNFYGFDSSYYVASQLRPGESYWIRASQAGEVVFNTGSRGLAKESISYNEEIDSDWGRISIEDSKGRIKTLYMGKENVKEGYYIPPVPPKGIYDVRYSSDRYVKTGMEEEDVMISSAEYPVYISISGMDVRIKDKLGSSLVNQIVRDGETFLLDKAMIDRLEISEVEIPQRYELSQNYPNPFNPSTKIKFGIPEDAKVRLVVYNVLGERVAELMDDKLEAGYYEVNFNAGSYATGVYIYRIESANFIQTKKMLLMK